jgi:hypothetical protein
LRAFWHLQSLTQIDDGAEIFYIIAYASCKLQKHEKNDMPFLLEMQAAFSGKERHEFFPNVKIPNVKIPNPENGENPEFFGIIFRTMLGEGERD